MMKTFDRNNPYTTYIQERYCLCDPLSDKQTWHITLDLPGSGLSFEPGDSVGICAQNDPKLVNQILSFIKKDPLTPIQPKKGGDPLSLIEFLSKKANLQRVTSSLFKRCTDKQAPKNLKTWDLLDLVKNLSPLSLSIQELCDALPPLLPRFYSIASCPQSSPQTIDLTVALTNWIKNGQTYYGVASYFLCHLAQTQATPVPLFVQPANHFRLPKDPLTPIIMIGPGTGVAPFRSFIQNRNFQSTCAKQWLFFGQRHRKKHFFYEEEWKQHPNLKIATAFSQDQSQKHYVQHKLYENAKEVHAWIEEGAHLYICGDKVMGRDVEQTLCQVISEAQGCTLPEAKEKLKQLKKLGRYQLDVY